MNIPVNLAGWLFLLIIIFASVVWFVLGKKWQEFDMTKKTAYDTASDFKTYKAVTDVKIKLLDEAHNKDLKLLTDGIQELNKSVNLIKDELTQNQKERYDELKEIVSQLKTKI